MMIVHEIFIDWIILVNNGKQKETFPPLTTNQLSDLRRYESKWIQQSKIYIENGNTVIELI